MKIAVCSDLHLEFGDLDLQNEENADVLILGGDIFIASDLEGWTPELDPVFKTISSARAERYNDFVVRCSQRFPNVILIMGNHEHYHGDFSKSAKIIRNAFGDLNNVHFLDKEFRVIDGVLFFGGTLWTDMNKEHNGTIHEIRYMMNDYNIVKNSSVGENCRFMPIDGIEDHKRFLTNLDEALNGHPDLPTVVVGHHAPSKSSTHPRYKDEFITNGAYSSDLNDFILDRRQIKLWTHGHTHETFDYMIGTTRIVCNPRGYDGYEARADDFTLKYVEI